MSDSSAAERLALQALSTGGTVSAEIEQQIRLRSTQLQNHRNQPNVHALVQIFTPCAKFFDADGRTIKGQRELLEYLTVLLEYGTEREGPPINFLSTKLFSDAKESLVIYDVGEYNWSPIENGRYVHKWIWTNDNFYLHHAYYKIDHLNALFPMIDENAPNS
uniref:SnoaL-like domain-containing protein n=1 Tax=Plectus sambesii TaxID=2011161 RepID=A0A914VNB0_9BILA